jgi:hypothetical protein
MNTIAQNVFLFCLVFLSVTSAMAQSTSLFEKRGIVVNTVERSIDRRILP